MKESEPHKTDLALPLKERLDEIDETFGREIFKGFYESRLKIEIGMWQKGKAIVEFRGVNSSTTYYQLEKQTGRSQESLKAWNDLYDKYRNYDRFLKEHAEPIAKAWTDKAMRQRGKLLPTEIRALPSGEPRGHRCSIRQTAPSLRIPQTSEGGGSLPGHSLLR